MNTPILDPISQQELSKQLVLEWDLWDSGTVDKIRIFLENTKNIDGRYTDRIFHLLISNIDKDPNFAIPILKLAYTPKYLDVYHIYLDKLIQHSERNDLIAISAVESGYKTRENLKIRNVLEQSLEKINDPLLLRRLIYSVLTHEKNQEYLKEILPKFQNRLPDHTVLKYTLAELDSKILTERQLTRVPPITRAIFAALPEDFRLSVLDGGATASEIERQFRDWPKDRWQVFGFDPHPDADLESDGEANVRMIRTGLGGKVGTAVLNHSRVDGASSLFDANVDYTRHLKYPNGRPLSDIMETIGQSTIDIVDLDTWRTTNEVDRFDFIKLNVQGAEKEIIEGAPETFEACMGIQTEVALAPVYKDAPMFRDIDGLMDRIGMTFFDMRKPNTAGRMSRRLNINPGSRSGGFRWPSRQITEAHVLYLRDPFRPEEQDSPRWQDPEAWLRLAIVAELNGQIEFAAQLCETVRDRFPDWIGDKLQTFDQTFDEAMVTYRDMVNRHF